MKKITILFLTLSLVFAILPSHIKAQTASVNTTTSNTEKDAEDAARATVLMNRLSEIKTLNKSELSRSDKKALRTEVKSIRSELKATGNGIYLSVGAIIIILLLLILLL